MSKQYLVLSVTEINKLKKAAMRSRNACCPEKSNNHCVVLYLTQSPTQPGQLQSSSFHESLAAINLASQLSENLKK